MAEAFQQSLQDILNKLEKLDVIEEAVNKLRTSFKKLERRIQSLKDTRTTTKRDVEDLKESLNSNEEDKKQITESLKNLKEKAESRLAAVDEENGKLCALLKEIENKNLYLEPYSRPENIKFENIPEDFTDKKTQRWCSVPSWRPISVTTTLLLLKYSESTVLEKRKEEKPRPILARLLRYKDCEKILSLGHRLKGTDFRMYQDLPFEIVERRRAQMDTFKKAKRNNVPVAFSKAQPDKLFIKGKLWPVGKPLKF